jgi:MSHA biogenesis protein MshQ
MKKTEISSRPVLIPLHFLGNARRWLNVLICASFSILSCAVSSPAFSADWWNANWSKCRDITIANTGTSALSNFPAYISLGYDSDMQSDYDDIRFINTTCGNNGSELDFEIESHSGTSADVWVKIDSLPAAEKTIAVYYGNASAASGEDVNGVWDGNHKGVWHLGENTDATNQDSTSNSNTGTPEKSPASDVGKIGNALNFVGKKETRVELGTDGSLNLSNYNNWTISLWVKPFSNFQSRKYPVMYVYGDYRATAGLAVEEGPDNGRIENYRNDSSGIYSNTNLTTNAWNHVVVARTEANTFFYLNGVADGSGSSVTIKQDNSGSYIGGYPSYKDGDLEGVIDEVRVSNVRRTPDWIKQSYQMVQNQSAHVSTGAEVQSEGGCGDDDPSECLAAIPILEYRFDECSYTGETGDVLDQTGSFNGDSNSVPAPTDEAIINKSLDLSTNDTSDWIDVPSSAVDGLDDFSVSVWFKTAVDKSQQEIFHALGDDTGDDELEIYLKDDDTIVIKVRDNSQELDTINDLVLTDDNWHHLVLTRVDEDVCLFIDGEEQECDDGVNGGVLSVSNADAIVIGQEQDSFGGNFSTSQNFVGQLDEFKIYDFSLSDSEIDSVYQNELAGNNYDGSSRDAVECEDFTVLSASAGVTCTNSIIEGDMGALGVVTKTGCVHDGAVVEEVSQDIQDDFSAAYSALANVQCPIGNNLTKLVGEVLPPGTYCFDNASVNIGGTLTLEGNESDTWLFKIGTAGTGALTGTDFVVEMSGGANACNVTWWVSEDATITRGAFKGDILAGKEITVTGVAPTSTLTGRVMADGNIELTNADILYSCEEAASPTIDHYRIEHDGQGFTCEAETIILKACVNANCDALYDQESSLTLSPSGLTEGGDITFTGLTYPELRYTAAETISLAQSFASPDAPLKCFISSTETCDINFVNAGFEFVGATAANKTLQDQIAENNFNNVNLRAVKDDGSAACVALLDDGLRAVDLSFDCDDPGTCKTDLYHGSIPLNELVSTSIELDFSGGIASLGAFNYADAGRLQLSANAVIDGSTITSGSAQVDVLPASLALNVTPASVIYAGVGDTDTYAAGEDFTLSIAAYGALGSNALPNYQAGSLQLKLTRNQPTAASASNGTLTYGAGGALSSSLSPGFTATSSLTFVEGVYSYSANYDEVGQISIDVRDDDYLGNVIASQDALILGDFIPAYFSVTMQQAPQLADTCAAAFTYIGEEITFDTESEAIIRITGKNALDQTTNNYSSTLWSYAPNLADVNDKLSYMDSSSYASTGTATVVLNGQTPLVSDNAGYDGSGLISVDGFRFRYNKVDVVNRAFDAVSPFAASIDMVFSADFLSDNGVCFKDNNADTDCNSFTIANITGTNLRYGRMVLDNTYGPDSEALTVNIKTEYYNADQWLLNTQDNCTAIDFTESSGQLGVVDKSGSSIANLVDPVLAAGMGGRFLTEGQSNDNNDLFFTAPNSAGVLILTLDPSAPGLNNWPDYLNIDWDMDGNIDTNDLPSATVTFGQFRGNDRIIHWREIFN